MIKKSLKDLLKKNSFVTIAEITALHDYSPLDIRKQAQNLYQKGVDIVAFSDQAFAKPKYLQLSQLIQANVFSHLPVGATLPILKVRTKTHNEIKDLCAKLKEQKVENLFIVTGDTSKNHNDNLHNSLSAIPKLAKDFFVGAVAHPQKKDLPSTIAKIQAGAKFLVVQASYNDLEYKKWVREIKRQEVEKMVPIITAVIPLTSPQTISVVRKTSDISIPKKLAKEFTSLDKDLVRKKGIEHAQKMIVTYKNFGIFSGVYIYSKSPDVVAALSQRN